MKKHVIVTFKSGVLDPQGKTIRQALNKQGYRQISSVRQGKYFEIEFDESCSEEEIRRVTQQISRDALSNPVIEDYRIEDER